MIDSKNDLSSNEQNIQIYSNNFNRIHQTISSLVDKSLLIPNDDKILLNINRFNLFDNQYQSLPNQFNRKLSSSLPSIDKTNDDTENDTFQHKHHVLFNK